MLPVVALVGRPNVGKSTLFNRLTGTRDALVADYPGLTRDRIYGYGHLGGRSAIIIDTGGLTGGSDALSELIERQIALAVGEADVVVLVADVLDGPMPDDHVIVSMLRRAGKPAVIAVNKAEGREAAEVAAAFYELGLGDPLPVSAMRGDALSALSARVLELAAPAEEAVTGDADADAGEAESTTAVPAGEPAAGAPIRLAVIGRPNVGKSTLINRYLGEERLLTMDEAGTTRDSISIPFVSDDVPYTLIDTAGIRRRSRVEETVERFSVVKSLQAVEEADAVLLLLDAREGVTEQDASLIGLVLERGRALAIGVNKWDGLTPDQRDAVRAGLDHRLPFLDFADIHFISARHGTAIHDLLGSGRRAAEAALRELSTPELNRVLRDAVEAYPTPISHGRRIRLTYAHQGGRRPPLIVIHGNQTEALPQSYRRYLMGCFRKAFRLRGTPIRIELRTGRNPFAGRRNELTPRQVRRRQRIRNLRRR